MAFVYKMGGDMAKLKSHHDAQLADLTLKTNVMWDFQMRRAMSEATGKGLATMNSPLTLTQAGIDAAKNLEPIRQELRNWWDENYFKSDLDASLELERHFGDRLLTLVCIPCAMSHGACLFLALMAAKNVNTIDFQFQH